MRPAIAARASVSPAIHIRSRALDHAAQDNMLHRAAMVQAHTVAGDDHEGTCADWAAETIGQKELPNEHAVNPKDLLICLLPDPQPESHRDPDKLLMPREGPQPAPEPDSPQIPEAHLHGSTVTGDHLLGHDSVVPHTPKR